MILHIVKKLKVLKILIRIFSLLFYFVVFYFARWRRREETAIESGKTKVKPSWLFCVCTSSLKFIGQTMCATKGVFAESVHCE